MQLFLFVLWVYVVLGFSQRTKIGRQTTIEFCKILEKDGFQCLSKNLYGRYCGTQSNAILHRERVQEQIVEKYPISIILVADKQNEYSYHFEGRKKCIKTQEKLLKKPQMVEFF